MDAKAPLNLTEKAKPSTSRSPFGTVNVILAIKAGPDLPEQEDKANAVNVE